ncbi:N-acetylmannosamine-6-phosphate 2-epimerase [Arthrobacter sp.]|uniref:N-acetylmannosamine-6-phosphate 2-epimerase n=1 Tax=Arthrobacter sp. TaxID=1667 RepID=UPI0028A0E8F3|nr:N-acetylmannosamine-6-phosphate 2-epimerase [Arthrobacter sp.]
MPSVIEAMHGGLIVSCQAYPGEPLRDPMIMARMAQAAVEGGAVAIRVQGIADIEQAVQAVQVPVIGLWKDGADGVFITPTPAHAAAVAKAGAHVVALDGTRRPRPDGSTLEECIAAVREVSDALIMADCGSTEDAVAAVAAGADLVGTTLSGYSGERPKTEGPDVDLVREMCAAVSVPVVAEGRVHSPAQAAEVLAAGAWAVCVGTAITHPTTLTRWFGEALASVQPVAGA